MIIVRLPYSTTGTCILFLNGTPGIGSDSRIPNRNHTSALTLMHCDMLEGYSILAQPNSGQEFRESYRDGITPNYTEFIPIPEFPELIPRAESIPQCSTLRNRMTALETFN
jgi:hypothetical protein